MKTITVQASTTYQINIGNGLLSDSGSMIRNTLPQAKNAAVISDTNVYPLYGALVKDALLASGFHVSHYVMPAGEASKNGNTFLAILNFLAENNFTRDDCIVALGGGVVGDISGFAAACYLRGISYVQIPTSLLAMVDSSVGGKTAIDLSAGKNLAGAFCQPSLVICDTDVLNTLPQAVFIDGCAEVIKYGVLFDDALFDSLTLCGISFDRETVIGRCVSLKRDIVCNDEFDRGQRQLLNLGHTIGHGIEKASNYAVTHGQAVGAGMAIVARASAAAGFCTGETADRILETLQLFRLPTRTDYSAETLYYAALSDKKRSGDTVNMITPSKIGVCNIRKMPIGDILSFIESGL